MWQGFRMTRSGLDAMPAPLRPLLLARIERLQQQQQQLAAQGEQLDEEELDDSGDEEPEQLTEVEENVEDQDNETDDDTGETDDDEEEEMEDDDVGETPEVTKALTQQDLYLGIHFPADEFESEIFPQLPEPHLGNHEVRVYDFRSNDVADFTDLTMGLRSTGNTYILGNKVDDPENWFSTNFSIPNRLSAGDRVYVQTDTEAPFLRLYIVHVLNLHRDPVPVPPLAPNGPYYLGWEIIKVLRRIDIEETFWIYQHDCPLHMNMMDPDLNQLEINVRDLQHTPVVPTFMTVRIIRGYIVFDQAQWQSRFVQRNNLVVGNVVGLYWDEAMECFAFARLAE